MKTRCATCGIAVRWKPTIIGSQAFCCIGCACGGPCVCDYEHLPELGDRAPLAIWSESKLDIRVYTVREE